MEDNGKVWDPLELLGPGGVKKAGYQGLCDGYPSRGYGFNASSR